MLIRCMILTSFTLILVGCQPAQQPAEPASTDPATGAATTEPNGGSGIAPMATPVPNAPVTGTESLQGGGSAAGTIAKDRAKGAAQKASGSSLGSEMGSE